MNGKTLRGHDLLKLFDALPPAAHATIKTFVPQCAANPTLEQPADVRSYLSELRDAFVNWRYCYELDRTDPVRIEPTIFVMEVLHHACLRHSTHNPSIERTCPGKPGHAALVEC